MSRIRPQPPTGLSYLPKEAKYFDEALLNPELESVFDICHGCRLCFNLCPSFPALFDAVDRYDGDVLQLTQRETDTVIDTCYQCKICYVKCTYTPGDGHEFQLDYPRLMQRAKAIRVRKHGLALRERLLGSTGWLGRLGRLFPWLTTLAPVFTSFSRS